jgi:hypothetical protein
MKISRCQPHPQYILNNEKKNRRTPGADRSTIRPEIKRKKDLCRRKEDRQCQEADE